MVGRKCLRLTTSNSLNTYGLLGAVCIAFVYAQTINYGYVNWDDDILILNNELVTQFNSNGLIKSLVEIFSSTKAGSYTPLTFISFSIDKILFGIENPWAWHLHNIILHLICSILVLKISVKLGLKPIMGFMLMLLFALHPMKVESVAWLSQRKDLLYSTFYLGAIYSYLDIKNTKNSILSNSTLMYSLFIASLLCKIQAVTLPLSLLCFDYLRDKTISKSKIIEKAPMLLVSFVFGLVSLSILSSGEVLNFDGKFSGFERFNLASFAYFSYIKKFFLPGELSAIYLLPSKLPIAYIISMLCLLPWVIFIYKLHQQRQHHWVFGITFFSVNVFFLLQWLGAGQGFLADRFTYMAYLGLAFSLVYQIQEWSKKETSYRLVTAVLPAIFILFLINQSLEQTKVWSNTETLFSNVLKNQGPSFKAYWIRANHFRAKGDYLKAKKDYDQAIAINPDKHEILNARAKLFFIMSQEDNNYLHLALKDFDEAINLSSEEKKEYLSNRGACYVKLANHQKALEDFDKALDLDANYANVYLNRSIVYNGLNNKAKAVNDLLSYLEINSGDHKIWYECSKLQLQLLKSEQALNSINNALSLNNSIKEYYQQRARIYTSNRQISLAKEDLRQYGLLEKKQSGLNKQLSIR